MQELTYETRMLREELLACKTELAATKESLLIARHLIERWKEEYGLVPGKQQRKAKETRARVLNPGWYKQRK